MQCIKTGFYAYLESASLYLRGDAFTLSTYAHAGEVRDLQYGDTAHTGNDHLLLRICAASVERPDRIHLQISAPAHWFEETKGEVVSPAPDFGAIWQPNSTMLVSPGEWRWLGYAGQEPKA